MPRHPRGALAALAPLALVGCGYTTITTVTVRDPDAVRVVANTPEGGVTVLREGAPGPSRVPDPVDFMSSFFTAQREPSGAITLDCASCDRVRRRIVLHVEKDEKAVELVSDIFSSRALLSWSKEEVIGHYSFEASMNHGSGPRALVDLVTPWSNVLEAREVKYADRGLGAAFTVLSALLGGAGVATVAQTVKDAQPPGKKAANVALDSALLLVPSVASLPIGLFNLFAPRKDRVIDATTRRPEGR